MRGFYKVLFFSLLLCGCQRELEDISNEAEVSDLIGSSYRSTERLMLRGITLDENYEEKVDVYSLGRAYTVEHSSPEEVTRESLSSGQLITVKKVLKCTNCFLSEPISVVVELTGYPLSPEKPVILSYILLSIDDESGSVSISKDYFRKISGNGT